MEWKPITEKGKIMTNSTNNISTDISPNGQKLEEVTILKYLGATLCKDDTCSAAVSTRVASAMAATARLNTRSGEADPSASQASDTGLLTLPSFSMIVRYGPYLPSVRKGSRLSKPSARGNFSASPTRNTRPATECGARATSLWVHMNLCGNCQETESRMLRPGMSCATTTSPEPLFEAIVLTFIAPTVCISLPASLRNLATFL